jgi:hypothetical protein
MFSKHKVRRQKSTSIQIEKKAKKLVSLRVKFLIIVIIHHT